jgi:predicted nuclease of restriction endonuclease-like RecB superfamily
MVEHRDKLFEHSESETKQVIARKLGRQSWSEIEAALYSDVFEYHRLKSFEGYPTPESLLSRYNVAQVQVALFFATRLIVHARADFQRIITHAKLARLMHDIRPTQNDGMGRGYTIFLDGPASLLRETRRYGTDMAKFLPALLSCRDWRLEADIQFKSFRRKLRLELSSTSGLQVPLPPPQEFDSSIEAAFARKWGPEPRNGWTLARAGKILHRQQTVFVPDFAFQHHTGKEALLEIVGFWTPEYLQAKLEKLKLFADEHIILAAAERVAQKWEGIPEGVIRYKSALKLDDVLAALG